MFAKSECFALLGPAERDANFLEKLQIEPGWLTAAQNGLLDVGRKKRKAQDAAIVRRYWRCVDKR